MTALVERPNVLLCRFEPEFLAVPPECLILTMKANQKYFPLLDAAGKLTNRFLVVSNIRPADPRRVVEGNERVVRPRLADAQFFFDQDRKKTLASRVAGLDKVVYHGKLGTQGERVGRVRAIARWVAERLGADVGQADRAARAGEGRPADRHGRRVSRTAGRDGRLLRAPRRRAGRRRRRDRVAVPEPARFAGAAVPLNVVGVALLIADKLETLVGIFGIGQKPTGDKDPFALRRHALTLIAAFDRVTVAAPTRRSASRCATLLEAARSTFASVALQPGTVEQVEDFVYERYADQLARRLRRAGGRCGDRPRPPLQRSRAASRRCARSSASPEAAALAAANKRVGNILKKADGAAPGVVDAALLQEPGETALHRALGEVTPVAQARFDAATTRRRCRRSRRCAAGRRVLRRR